MTGYRGHGKLVAYKVTERGDTVINRSLLRAEIVKNEMTQAEVAKKIGISPKTFSLKMKKGVFGTDEALKLVKLLNIQNGAEIFLPKQ